MNRIIKTVMECAAGYAVFLFVSLATLLLAEVFGFAVALFCAPAVVMLIAYGANLVEAAIEKIRSRRKGVQW